MFEGQLLDLEEVSVEKVLAFRDEHARWMCVGTHTVLSTIIRWMAYGKGHWKKLGGQLMVWWTNSGDALVYCGEWIVVEDFKRIFRVLVDKAESLLDRLMFGSWAEVNAGLDMGWIADSMIRLGGGGLFATKEENSWL